MRSKIQINQKNVNKITINKKHKEDKIKKKIHTNSLLKPKKIQDNQQTGKETED